MRSVFPLLVLLLAGFLFAGSRPGEGVAEGARTAAGCSVDRERGDEWLCERACNSDLDLPRADAGGTVAPVGVQRPAKGSADSRTVVRALSVRHAARGARVSSFQNAFNPAAVPHAVDRYVYRLRRLII